jgi:hypothetical protein
MQELMVAVLSLYREFLTGWAAKKNLLKVFRGEEVLKETLRVFSYGPKSLFIICQVENK